MLTFIGASLVAYSLVNVLARAFYPLGATKTPVKVSLRCHALNMLFSL